MNQQVNSSLSFIKTWCETAVQTAKEDFQVDLDYSIESIKEVDRIVGSWHDLFKNTPIEQKPDEQTLWNFSVIYGTYLGETIRKKYGGNWVEEPKSNGNPIYLDIKGTRAYPISKVYKRITNGFEDSPTFLQCLKGSFKSLGLHSIGCGSDSVHQGEHIIFRVPQGYIL